MMYKADHYDVFWSNIIKQLPKGGSYNFSQRAEGYRKILDLVPHGSKTFDYACGLGMVSIKLAKEKGCDVSGTDFSKVAIEYVKKQSGGNFNTSGEVFGENYDYIILSHFLEHITNPVEFMKDLYKKGKNVIVALPNNFRHIGEHVNMQWNNWKEFDELFKDFDYERVDNGYTTKTHHAWHHPIFLFKGDTTMHPSYLDSSTGEKKATVKKVVKKVAKKGKKKIVEVIETETVSKTDAESKSNSY